MTATPQQLGYQWDAELAQLIQGERHVGSGNRAYQRLDASGHTIIFSGKHTIHRSFSVTEDDLDEAVRATVGPESMSAGLIPILAVKFGGLGASNRKVAVLDLLQLIDWLRKPPELVPATKQDAIRQTARTPPHLRP